MVASNIRTLTDIRNDLDSIIAELVDRQPSPDRHGHSADYAVALSRARECYFWLTSAIGNQASAGHDASGERIEA